MGFVRLVGYIRVSSVAGRAGDSFISPSVQREKIEGYAALHGHTIVAILEELDESGGSMDRPLLQEALSVVDAGAADGIVVAKLDRFGRTLVGALDAIRRLEQAGGQLVSVDDQFDTSTPMGRFALQIMLALAELEHARIRENWRVAQQRAVDRGVHISPRVPVGYRRDHSAARLEPDPATAPAIRDAFQMRADGVTMEVIADMLNQRGVRTSYGGSWIGQTVQRLLTNRVYLGEARGAGGVHPVAGAHEALTTPALFEYNAHRRGTGNGAHRANSTALLAGLLRCAGCRYVMTRSGVRADGRSHRYKCRGRHTVGECPAPTAVHPHIIEAFVVEQFLAALNDDSPLIEVAALNISVEPLRQTLDRADAELAAWRDDEELLTVGRDIYIDGLHARARRRDEAHRHLQEALAGLDAADAFDHAVTLRDEFPALPVIEQRTLIAATIDVVFLRRMARNTPIADRALILWRGEGPTDLPRPAKPNPLRSFAFPADRDITAGMTTTSELGIRRSERPTRSR